MKYFSLEETIAVLCSWLIFLKTLSSTKLNGPFNYQKGRWFSKVRAFDLVFGGLWSCTGIKTLYQQCWALSLNSYFVFYMFYLPFIIQILYLFLIYKIYNQSRANYINFINGIKTQKKRKKKLYLFSFK